MKTRTGFRVTVWCFAVAALLAPLSASEAPTGLWAKIHSPDIATYAANLRAAGVPEATVGVLISQEINARFKDRERALEPSVRSLATLKEGWSAERREALLQLKRQKNDLLRATLGVVPNETARVESIPASLASATLQQREMVRLILEDYYAMTAKVHTESRGYLFDEDREKLNFLEGELNADLAKVLGPEKSLDYQIERDPSIRFLQQRLELFKPTLQEMREIYVARRSTGLDIEARNRNSSRLTETQKAMLAEIKKRWSPERYAEYTRLASSLYQQTFHLVRRLNLPPDVADQIFESHKLAVEKAWAALQASRLGQQPGTDPIARTAPSRAVFDLAKQLAADHCALVKNLLGEAGYAEYYRQNPWLDAMLTKGSIGDPANLERHLPL